MPILLDVGTDNEELLNDPLYIGWRHRRKRGHEYNDFIESFVQAVVRNFPGVVLQWEDFAQTNAYPLLERYRDRLASFNDDIQGTAAVARGAILAAVAKAGSSLKDQHIVVTGAGSAGCGISNLLRQCMVDEGLSESEAQGRFFLIDNRGLLVQGDAQLSPLQEQFAQPREAIKRWSLDSSQTISLHDVVKNAQPTILIGVSGQPGIFSESIVREMALHTRRPIIFPLSNPTSKSEAKPLVLSSWTQDQAIIGTGSPFSGVDQVNNSYIFPGVGLGLIASRATRVSDAMFKIAAKALAEYSPSTVDPNAALLPPLANIRAISVHIACAIGREAISSGLSSLDDASDIEKRVADAIWHPVYHPYKKA